MQVTLIALGSGAEETLTAQARAALRAAACILGAPRLLEGLGPEYSARRIAAIRPEDLMALLLAESGPCAVVYSGDIGFYSGARQMLLRLREQGMEARVLPGLSSVQLLAARLGRPWQDWTLCSAHGTDCDPAAAVMEGKSTFFLTGGALGPAALCARLSEAGLGRLPVTVGENLACAGERIVCGTAEELQTESFASLSVLLAEAAPCAPRRAPGWPDAAFVRGAVPMTKQMVRAAVLAQLGAAERGVYWDVGAGTGSVSVELAVQCRRGTVYAVERRSEACALIRANREKFCAWNLRVVEGRAPEALEELPAPEGMFVGGSGGALDAIVAAALQKNARARIVISAIALETVGRAMEVLQRNGLTPQAAQLSVSETKGAGGLHLLQANNPVFLIAGGGND